MGTPVKLPPALLYPVEILEVLISPQQPVKRQQRLLKFKYWNRVPDGVAEDGEDEVPLVLREFYGYLESPYDGIISCIFVQKHDRINDSDFKVCSIEEGCDHSVQYGGLCALCGRSLDQKDYLGYNDVDRAPIAMSHDTSGLTVSFKEAERIETRSTKQLIDDRRLVLVVDLDQTVIHASVSPEIGEWANDPSNPHYQHVKDVQRFALRERPAAGGGVTVVSHTRSILEPLHWTPQLQQPDIRWYYIKMRPGLHEFLEEMNSKYEMHVYTMATRHYALEVTRAIDPSGKFFADRILSRDTSGSLLYKDLKRLFPVSTNMVTIIDDRGDVWNWTPHLVRCVPYHFWSNTGDINSQFLPKRSGLVTPGSENADIEGGEEVSEIDCRDHELESIGKALKQLHSNFYRALRTVPESEFLDDSKLPDVGKLLPTMKEQVFDGCVLLFSGFFPVNLVDLDSADIVQWVRSFGAVVVAQYIPSVTHVVTRTPGTMKSRQAAGQGKCVVQIEWVFKCLEKWSCVDETPYLWQVPNPITGSVENGHNRGDQENAELDANIASRFVRSLQRGDVNWDAMDEELKELLAYNDSDGDNSDRNGEPALEENMDSKESSIKYTKDENTEYNPLKRKRDEESDFEIDLEDDWD